MKFAYSTNAYTKHSLEDAIRSVAKLGYTGIEILCDKPHWFMPDINPQDIDRAIVLLAQQNLSVSNLNANTADGYFAKRTDETAFEPALSNTNNQIRQQRIEYTKQVIDAGARVKARAISVTSGLPKQNPAREKTAFVESLKHLCDYAEKKQVRIGIEYEPGLLIEYAEQVCDIIEQVGSPLLGVNFDIGHSYLNNEDPAKTVAMLGERIWNIHIEDIKNDTHFHMIPGTGEIPFPQYFEALEALKYGGFITVELYTFADAPEAAGAESIAYLKKYFQQHDK